LIPLCFANHTSLYREFADDGLLNVIHGNVVVQNILTTLEAN